MGRKKEIYIKILNQEKINDLNNQFNQEKERIHKKVYNSLTEERMRTSKIIISKVICDNVDNVFKSIVSKIAKDFHSDLKYEDLEENFFYKTSSKSNNIIFKLFEFEINKALSIEYFVNNQHFIRTFKFIKNNKNTKTKIIYIDLVTGMVSINGWYERHIRNVYIRKQIIAFKIQMMNAMLDLNLVKENKIEKLKIKINKMLEFSKKIF